MRRLNTAVAPPEASIDLTEGGFRLAWRDHGYAVLDAKGGVVGRAGRSLDVAIGTLARVARQASRRERPCMCCRKPFVSEGTFNRLCGPCSHVRSGLGREWDDA